VLTPKLVKLLVLYYDFQFFPDGIASLLYQILNNMEFEILIFLAFVDTINPLGSAGKFFEYGICPWPCLGYTVAFLQNVILGCVNLLSGG
jgi:hypothetical protein